eukprot:3086972-Pyramimonas_sp.AAC.1
MRVRAILGDSARRRRRGEGPKQVLKPGGILQTPRGPTCWSAWTVAIRHKCIVGYLAGCANGGPESEFHVGGKEWPPIQPGTVSGHGWLSHRRFLISTSSVHAPLPPLATFSGLQVYFHPRVSLTSEDGYFKSCLCHAKLIWARSRGCPDPWKYLEPFEWQRKASLYWRWWLTTSRWLRGGPRRAGALRQTSRGGCERARLHPAGGRGDVDASAAHPDPSHRGEPRAREDSWRQADPVSMLGRNSRVQTACRLVVGEVLARDVALRCGRSVLVIELLYESIPWANLVTAALRLQFLVAVRGAARVRTL